tara:strand:- start:5103 stop:5273 length:171 start_codon:yes stop_codon:yes gene_type:complete
MSEPKIFLFIKTPCGRAKYNELSKRTKFIDRIRFYWFVFFAIIQDWNLPQNENQSE